MSRTVIRPGFKATAYRGFYFKEGPDGGLAHLPGWWQRLWYWLFGSYRA